MFAEHRARVEGVHGWVRNLPDGRVEVRVEGDRESVDRVEAALRRGPGGAHVESFEMEDDVPTGRATGFSVRD
jgi:acylphosphatase